MALEVLWNMRVWVGIMLGFGEVRWVGRWVGGVSRIG